MFRNLKKLRRDFRGNFLSNIPGNRRCTKYKNTKYKNKLSKELNKLTDKKHDKLFPQADIKQKSKQGFILKLDYFVSLRLDHINF